jgi:phosphate transport system substrate-binding protein
MRRILASAVTALAVTASLFVASPAQAAEVDITGSGSSFAYNFINKCASQYQAKTGSKVSYTAKGSGTGRKEFAAGSTDFGASDVVYGASDTKPAGDFVTIPVIGGAVAIVFNVAGVKDLNLDAATLGKIFSGAITSWDDAAIKALNPKAKLPTATIVVAYRSTNSGTTENVQAYLAANGGSIGSGQAWAGTKSGVGVAQSSDMAYKVAHTDNAIGYVDLSDVDVKVGKVALKNAKGKFVKPTAAAAQKVLSKQTINADGSVTIDWTKKVTGGYNLAIVTYMFVPKAAGTAKSQAAAKFAQYAVDTCSKKPFKGYTGFSGANLKKASALAKQGS